MNSCTQHSDFRSSFTDGRLERQPLELGEEQNGMLLITGDPYKLSLWKGTTMKPPDSVSRLLVGLGMKHTEEGKNIDVRVTPSDSQVPVIIDYIATKIENGEIILEINETTKKAKKKKKKGERKTPEYHDLTLYSMLLQIDRMPKKVAIAILEHCNYDFEVLYRKSESDLKDLGIDNYGKVLRKLTYETFHKKVYTI